MQKYSLTIVLVFSSVLCSWGQNLVPNGSFEEGVTCPTFIGNFDIDILDWYTSAINFNGFLPTPEWYHTCSEQESFSPPDVAFGSQFPFDGNGYAGFVTYSIIGFDTNYREILGVPLNSPLVVGESYLVNFKLGRLVSQGTSIASNNIGFHFTTEQFFQYPDFPINNAHFTVDTVLDLNGEWLEINELFVADSAYNYFHLGNFYNDENTTAEIQDEGAGAAYYVVDQIEISQILSDNSSQFMDGILIYPNPSQGTFTLLHKRKEPISNIRMFDLTGQLIEEFNLRNESSKQVLNFQEKCGTYMLEISTAKTIHYAKIIILEN